MTDLNKINENDLVIPEGTVTLQGFKRFAFTALKESRIIVDGFTMNFLICTAELTFNDKETFVLHTKEFIPETPILYREVYFKGEMAPNGLLKFTWPETWWEMEFEGIWKERTGIFAQIRRHTGMVVFGQGISNNTLNYMGYFDGNKLFANMPAVGLPREPGQMELFKKLVEGPVMINFIFDLEITH
jgi:hypothetical protein